MDNWIDIKTNEAHIKKERLKAKELRKKNWWKALIQKGECYRCGKKFPPKELTMDHIVPLSRGGRSNKGNVAPCCKECNNKKKYLTPCEELIKEQ